MPPYDADELRLEKTLDPAFARCKFFFRTGTGLGHNGESRWPTIEDVTYGLRVFEKEYKQGKTFALLKAISWCAEANLPLPTWAATAFIDRMDSFLDPDGPHTLDILFGNTFFKTKKRARARRKDWEMAGELWGLAVGAQMAGQVTSIDAAVREAIKFVRGSPGITKARKLILEQEELERSFQGGGLQGFSRLRRNSRKTMP